MQEAHLEVAQHEPGASLLYPRKPLVAAIYNY
jgi:hypothetical protein